MTAPDKPDIDEQILQNQLAEADRRAAGRPEPVGAQHRFRHPQKTMPDWSPWQPCAIEDRPAWTIDSVGYEVEYRNIYGPDLLAAYDRVAAERDRHMGAVQAYIEDAEHLTRQFAELQAKHEALVRRLREPTQEMQTAGVDATEFTFSCKRQVRDAFRAMSAVALDKGGE